MDNWNYYLSVTSVMNRMNVLSTNRVDSCRSIADHWRIIRNIPGMSLECPAGRFIRNIPGTFRCLLGISRWLSSVSTSICIIIYYQRRSLPQKASGAVNFKWALYEENLFSKRKSTALIIMFCSQESISQYWRQIQQIGFHSPRRHTALRVQPKRWIATFSSLLL